MSQIDHPPVATQINVQHFWDDSATKVHNTGDNPFPVVKVENQTDPVTGLPSQILIHSNGQQTRKGLLKK